MRCRLASASERMEEIVLSVPRPVSGVSADCATDPTCSTALPRSAEAAIIAVSLRVDLFQIDLLWRFAWAWLGKGVAQPSEEKEENMSDAESAEAELRQEKATLHERRVADQKLIEDHERERFAGTSAVPDSGAGEER